MSITPEPMSPVELAERLDALAAEFMAGATSCNTDRQACLRSTRATWCAVLSHAEHRVHQATRIAGPIGGRA
ncbi:hypothetical protein [Stenotrophomonas maltophilia]|uniref:hypothetical protein n=1 Tax=Stenotrophomonas maltophilia TaxID=40324 RepID=UPI002B1D9787|nr:hypothetical protein [Stenotrophomonas maltophilia]